MPLLNGTFFYLPVPAGAAGGMCAVHILELKTPGEAVSWEIFLGGQEELTPYARCSAIARRAVFLFVFFEKGDARSLRFRSMMAELVRRWRQLITIEEEERRTAS